MAPRSCRPQSQRSEPNRSPVKHSEWRRMSTGSVGIDLADHDGEMLLAAVARPPGEDAGVLRALERHVRLRHLLQVARGGLLVGQHVGGIDIDQVLLAGPVAPLVAVIAAERAQHDGGQQAGELGELDGGLGDARGVAHHRPRQGAQGDMAARPALVGALSCGRRMTSTGTPSGRSSVIGLLVSPMPPAICGGISMPIASARRRVVTRTGASWARPCRRCRARGPQDSAAITRPPGAVIVAQHDDAAAAQLGHGALDGG